MLQISKLKIFWCLQNPLLLRREIPPENSIPQPSQSLLSIRSQTFSSYFTDQFHTTKSPGRNIFSLNNHSYYKRDPLNRVTGHHQTQKSLGRSLKKFSVYQNVMILRCQVNIVSVLVLINEKIIFARDIISFHEFKIKKSFIPKGTNLRPLSKKRVLISFILTQPLRLQDFTFLDLYKFKISSIY